MTGQEYDNFLKEQWKIKPVQKDAMYAELTRMMMAQTALSSANDAQISSVPQVQTQPVSAAVIQAENIKTEKAENKQGATLNEKGLYVKQNAAAGYENMYNSLTQDGLRIGGDAQTGFQVDNEGNTYTTGTVTAADFILGDKSFKEAGVIPGSVKNVSYGIALGNESSVSAMYGTAAGKGAQVSGWGSTAIGANTSVSGKNSVAIGYGSQATENNVVSVGGYADGTQRRVIGVAAGVNDTDAVNVSQLKKTEKHVKQGSYAAENGQVKMDVVDGNDVKQTTGVTITNVASKTQQDTNTENISTNTQNISNNKTQIETNMQNITKNAGDITTINGTLTGAVMYDKTDNAYNKDSITLAGTAYNKNTAGSSPVYTGGTSITNVAYAQADRAVEGYKGYAAVNVDLMNDRLSQTENYVTGGNISGGNITLNRIQGGWNTVK